MGTRISYVIESEDGTLATLYSNSSHPIQNPSMIAADTLSKSIGPSSFVESLLSIRYTEDGGNHLANDRMFWLAPIAEDADSVATVHFFDNGEIQISFKIPSAK